MNTSISQSRRYSCRAGSLRSKFTRLANGPAGLLSSIPVSNCGKRAHSRSLNVLGINIRGFASFDGHLTRSKWYEKWSVGSGPYSALGIQSSNSPVIQKMRFSDAQGSEKVSKGSDGNEGEPAGSVSAPETETKRVRGPRNRRKKRVFQPLELVPGEKIPFQKVFKDFHTPAYGLELLRGLAKQRKQTFDQAIEMHVELNLDVRKPDQAIKSTADLPRGHGKKNVRVIVFAEDGEESDAAKAAGATVVGVTSTIANIKAKRLKIKKTEDKIIATPAVMGQVKKHLGKILGPKGLMPNNNLGTVVTRDEFEKTIDTMKRRNVLLKTGRYPIVQTRIGSLGFSDQVSFITTGDTIHPLIRYFSCRISLTTFERICLQSRSVAQKLQKAN